MRCRILTLMKLVAVSGLVLGVGAWLGWRVFGALLAASIGLTLALLPLAGLMLILLHWMVRGLVLLSGLLLFCSLALSWAIAASALLPVPICDQFASSGLGMGLVLGLYVSLGLTFIERRARHLAARQPGGLRGVAWRNALLAVLALTLFAAWSAVPSIKWGSTRSVALAVTASPGDSLTVDLYGHGGSQKTVNVALDKRLEPGSAERIHCFGRDFKDGFIPYTERTGGRLGTLRRLVFHHTLLDDQIVPLLTPLSQLEYLDLRGTRISLIGVRRLRTALPRCKVVR